MFPLRHYMIGKREGRAGFPAPPLLLHQTAEVHRVPRRLALLAEGIGLKLLAFLLPLLKSLSIHFQLDNLKTLSLVYNLLERKTTLKAFTKPYKGSPITIGECAGFVDFTCAVVGAFTCRELSTKVTCKCEQTPMIDDSVLSLCHSSIRFTYTP